jgi:hypothetical protein
MVGLAVLALRVGLGVVGPLLNRGPDDGAGDRAVPPLVVQGAENA